MKRVYLTLVGLSALLGGPVFAGTPASTPVSTVAPGTAGYVALHGGANVYQSFDDNFSFGELRSISITTLAGMVESSSATSSGQARIASPLKKTCSTTASRPAPTSSKTGLRSPTIAI